MEMKGYEMSKYILVCFGGVGFQYVCVIVRVFGMREVIIYCFCGILSVYGMGFVDVVEEVQEFYVVVYFFDLLVEVKQRVNKLVEVVIRQFCLQGFCKDDIKVEMFFNF